ncbi:hypothetical protein [Clostridium sp.]|uniref:hypothetical protein n=1 Tax=Clostridium sp. TaxID=1506 RepID=UPI002611F7B8|nr:hypothetical protein [Clostridium sp.]
MNCVSVEDIVSTTVQYESFFNFDEFLKISKKSIDIFLSITKGHKIKKKYCNVENCFLKNFENVFFREFTYKFNKDILINKIKYPSINKEFTYYEIYEVKKDKDELILFGSYVKEEKGFFEILLNERKVNNIKIKLISKKDSWPKVKDIIFEKA